LILVMRVTNGSRGASQSPLRGWFVAGVGYPALRCACLAGRRAACRARYNRRSAADGMAHVAWATDGGPNARCESIAPPGLVRGGCGVPGTSLRLPRRQAGCVPD